MKTIKLTKGKIVLVDDNDYEFLSQWKWYASIAGKKSKLWYAQRTDYSSGRRKTIKMHRLLLNPKKENVVDHIDGNGLNNQKSNLKECTQQQNILDAYGRRRKNGNTKPVGVFKEGKKWVARVFINVGRFENREDAIKARKNFIIEKNL